MSIPIQQFINEAVNEKREKKEITSWHISKLGSCLRGIYYERLGVKPDKEFDDRTLRVFSVGKMFESWLIDKIKDKVKIEEQVRVEDKKLGVSGYADFVAEVDGVKKVYEVKSKHSRSFWYMKKRGKPQRQHEYQLWTYLYLLGIDRGSLIYLSKDDLAILEYPVLLADEKLKGEVMTEIKLLNEAWKKKDPSLLPLYEDKDWRSKYCRYHSYCKKEQKLNL